MKIRHTQRRQFNITAICLCAVLVLSWLTPALAIKAVQDDPKRVEKGKDSAEVKRTAVSGSSTTRSLLKDVERQKARSADSLDTWIDRNGDGVNDRLKNPPRRKVRDNSEDTEKAKSAPPQPKETSRKREKKPAQSDTTVRTKRR